MSPVPNYGKSLEERARKAVDSLPKKQQAQVLQACRALDQVGRRDARGRVSIDEGHLRATLKTHLPPGFVDGYFDEFRRRMVGTAAEAAPGVDVEAAEEELRRAQKISWIELAAALSPYEDLPREETMEGLGLSARSSTADIKRVITSRLPDYPDAAFQGPETVALFRRGTERLAKLPRGQSLADEAPDNSSSAADVVGVSAPPSAAAAGSFDWRDFFYCMKDRWLEWLVLSLATFIFLLFAAGLAVALTLAVIYVPFWALVTVVACIIWAFS